MVCVGWREAVLGCGVHWVLGLYAGVGVGWVEESVQSFIQKLLLGGGGDLFDDKIFLCVVSAFRLELGPIFKMWHANHSLLIHFSQHATCLPFSA